MPDAPALRAVPASAYLAPMSRARRTNDWGFPRWRGYGSSRGWGYYGWSPLGLLILIVLILALTGNLSF